MVRLARPTVSYPPGYNTQLIGSYPLFCSRNSGLVYKHVLEYRVFLGKGNRLPSIHSFETLQEAQSFLNLDTTDYQFIQLVVLVEQDGFYLECPKGPLYFKDTRYRFFPDKKRYSEWDLGYFENHQSQPSFSLF